MSSQGVVRKAVAFTDKVEAGLAGLEEDFYLPALSVNPDDLFFRKFRICADKGDPVLPVLFVADAYDLCRDMFILTDLDVYREKVLAAAAALFADTEYLPDGQLLSFVFVVNTGALLDHGDGIQS